MYLTDRLVCYYPKSFASNRTALFRQAGAYQRHDSSEAKPHIVMYEKAWLLINRKIHFILDG